MDQYLINALLQFHSQSFRALKTLWSVASSFVVLEDGKIHQTDVSQQPIALPGICRTSEPQCQVIFVQNHLQCHVRLNQSLNIIIIIHSCSRTKVLGKETFPGDSNSQGTLPQPQGQTFVNFSWCSTRIPTLSIEARQGNMGKNLFARFLREKDPPKTSGNVCCGWLPPVYFLPSHLTRYWSPGSPASLHQCHIGEPTRLCIKDAISNNKSSFKKWWPMAYGSLVVYERNNKLSKRKWTWSFKRFQ